MTRSTLPPVPTSADWWRDNVLTAQWRVRPPIDPPKGGLWIGAGVSREEGVWLGSLAEVVASGRQSRVWLATGKEQVVAVVGKRGSGKSFTLGVIAEGLASDSDGELGRQERPRAVLLFDPLDVYWTTRYAVAKSENAEARRHYELAQAAGLPSLEFDVEAWIPGEAIRRSADPDWFQTLEIPASAMGLEEWEMLLGVNTMTDPMGQALADALTLVREGFHRHGEEVPPTDEFGLEGISEAVLSDELAAASYHAESIRALRQRLGALENTGLFGEKGTRIGDLLAPGRVTVIMLGRLPQSYRAAVVAVLTRMLMEERSATAFAEKRLAIDPELDQAARKESEAVAEAGVAPTVVVLDEAQSFLAPGQHSPARDLFVRLVKEGRNMGLSAVVATQQPSALDQRVLSQVETFISHQLVTEADIRAVRDNLKSEMPSSIQYGNQALEFGGLLRQLPPGYCMVSAADVNTSVRRSMVVAVRPRATVHGGIETVGACRHACSVPDLSDRISLSPRERTLGPAPDRFSASVVSGAAAQDDDPI